MSLELNPLLLLLLLPPAGYCSGAAALVQSGNQQEFPTPGPGGICIPDWNQYCCYNKKCAGVGKYVNKTIKCDQQTHSCTVDSSTGYPECVVSEEGGEWVLCIILGTQSAWWTFGCSYDSWGRVTGCNSWHSALYYISWCLPFVTLVVVRSIVLIIRHIRRKGMERLP